MADNEGENLGPAPADLKAQFANQGENLGPADISKLTAPSTEAPPAPSWVDHAVQYGYDGASPVAPPDAFINRVTKPEDPMTTKLWNALSSAKDAAVTGYGDDPLVGIHPGGEAEKELQKMGVFAQPGVPSDLRLMTEAMVRPTAALADLVGRLGSAGVAAMSDLVGSAAEGAGLQEKNVAKENAQSMLEWAATRGDVLSFSKPHIAQDGKVTDLNVGTVPQPEHFMQAADALTNGKGTPEIAQHLSQIYDEHGIHPAEMVAEAADNPAVRDALISRNPDAPPPGLPGPPVPEDTAPPNGGGLPPAKPPGGELGGVEGEPVPQPHPLQGAADAIWDKLSVDEGDVKTDRPFTWSRFYTATVDKFNPWFDAVKNAMTPDALKNLGTVDNPYRLARLVPGWQWVAHGFLNEGPRDFYTSQVVGEGLSDIMADVKKVQPEIPGYSSADEFRVFLASARARELSLRDIDHPIDDDDAISVGRALAPKYGDLERRVLEYQNRVATYARDSGVLSKAGHEAMLEANKFYVPFYRVVAQAAKRVGANLSQSFEAGNPFFKIEGNENYRIIDPLESIVKDTYLITSMAQKNVAATKMIDLLLQRDAMVQKTKTGTALAIPPSAREVAAARELFTGKRIEPPSESRNALTQVMGKYDGFRPPTTLDVEESYENAGSQMGSADPAALAGSFEPILNLGRGDNDVTILRDGKPYTYTVEPELARSMKQLDTETAGWLSKWMSYPASTLRAGAVLAPDFWVRHSFRDYFYAFTTTAGGLFTPVDMMKGMMAFAVHSPELMDYISKLPPMLRDPFNGLHAQFWDAMHHGAGGTSFVAFDRRGIQADLNKLSSEHPDLWTRSYNVVMDPSSPVWDRAKALGGLPAGGIQRLYHGAQFVTEMITSASHLGAYLRDQRLQKGSTAEAASMAMTIPELKGTEMRPADGYSAKESADVYGHIVRRPDLENQAIATAQSTDVGRARMGEIDPKSNYMGFGWRPKRSATAPTIENNPPRFDSPEKKAMLHSAWVARDTAVDAQRIGAYMKAWNMVSAFANIKIQESAKLGEQLYNNPVDTGMKIGVGITLPSVLLWAYNHNQSWYQDMPDWEKNTFWLFHVRDWQDATPEQVSTMKPDMVRLMDGKLQMDNGTTWRLPKPFTMGVLFGSGPERMLDAWQRDRPKEVADWVKSLGESTVGDMSPTVGLPMLEQYSNRSSLTGGPIVSDRLKEGLPEYQYNDYTSPTAKALGRIVGAVPYIGHGTLGNTSFASPMVIQNYVRQWTGTLGDYALQLADKIGQKAGAYSKPADTDGTWSDVPVIKAFAVRYPSMGAQPITDFYDNVTEVTQMQATFKRLQKDGDLAGASQLAAMGGDELGIQLGQYRTSLNRINGLVHQINNSAEMKPYEKRQMIDSLYYQAITIAQQGNAMVKQAKAAAQKASP